VWMQLVVSRQPQEISTRQQYPLRRRHVLLLHPMWHLHCHDSSDTRAMHIVISLYIPYTVACRRRQQRLGSTKQQASSQHLCRNR
jgi:hypothetical protein